jgi:phosphatidylglycerophosphatase A
MPIKESSDELNPPVVTTGVSIARARGSRTVGDYLALAMATCGVGYLPLAPGTWGSLVGVGFYLLLHKAFGLWLALRLPGVVTDGGQWPGFSESSHLEFAVLLLVLCLVVSAAGVWAATRAESLLGRKDPGAVVLDEVAGQLITFLFIPYLSQWWVIAAGFLLFRAFDIWKPYPVRRLEGLESGLGIMADDVLAGIYAATVLSLATLIYSLV